MDYEGIKLQVVEIPAILRGFDNSDKGPLFLGIIRNADLVMFLLREDPEREFELLITELENNGYEENKPVRRRSPAPTANHVAGGARPHPSFWSMKRRVPERVRNRGDQTLDEPISTR